MSYLFPKGNWNKLSFEEIVLAIAVEALFPQEHDKRLWSGPMMDNPLFSQLVGKIPEKERREERELILRFFETGSFGPSLLPRLTRLAGSAVLDTALDQAFKSISGRSENVALAARKRALSEIQAAYDDLEKQGLLKPGDDVLRKQREDPTVRQAIADARARILERLEAEIINSLALGEKEFGEALESRKPRENAR